MKALKILKKLIKIIFITTIISAFCFSLWFGRSLLKVEKRISFTKQELELFEQEFDFDLKNNEYISMAKFFGVDEEYKLQIWVNQIDDYKIFIQQRLKMDLNDFKPKQIGRYSDHGRILYNDDKSILGSMDGFENVILKDEIGYVEYAIELYPNKVRNSYVATFYKIISSNNEKLIKMFY